MTKYFLRRTKAVVNTFFWWIKAVVITWFVFNNVTSYKKVKQPNTFYNELRLLLMRLFWRIKVIIRTCDHLPFPMNFDHYLNLITTLLIHYLQQNNSVDNKREIIYNILIVRKDKSPKSFSIEITRTNP